MACCIPSSGHRGCTRSLWLNASCVCCPRVFLGLINTGPRCYTSKEHYWKVAMLSGELHDPTEDSLQTLLPAAPDQNPRRCISDLHRLSSCILQFMCHSTIVTALCQATRSVSAQRCARARQVHLNPKKGGLLYQQSWIAVALGERSHLGRGMGRR